MVLQQYGSDATRQAQAQEPERQPVPRRAWLMLALATVGFALNFWAWALLSPLGPAFKDGLHLTSFEQSLLVAVPVVVGSLGRAYRWAR